MTHTSVFKLEYEESLVNSVGSTNVGAVIVAAGNSTRMGGKNKLLMPLLGWPVILRTIMAFEKHPNVKNIVVVTSSEAICDIQNIISKHNLSKVTDVVLGGETRQDSVEIGFETLIKNGDVKTVLIHDGARPLVSDEVISRVILGTENFGAAIPTVPLKDTVKKVGSLGRVESTPERSTMAAVQTPQGFLKEVYEKALITAGDNLSKFTDDSSLVEESGQAVYAVEGDYKNIKITTPEDICVAEAYINNF